MISDEIIRRRIPPAYGYRIPHSDFIDLQDPSLLDFETYSSHLTNEDLSENTISNGADHIQAQRIDGDEIMGRHKIPSPKLFPNSYAHRIATDQAIIASDIRKYLSSNHVNPLGNFSYFEKRRRLAKFSYSF